MIWGGRGVFKVEKVQKRQHRSHLCCQGCAAKIGQIPAFWLRDDRQTRTFADGSLRGAASAGIWCFTGAAIPAKAGAAPDGHPKAKMATIIRFIQMMPSTPDWMSTSSTLWVSGWK